MLPSAILRTSALRRLAEVLGRDLVEELAELLDFVFLLVGDRHPDLVQDLVGGEDRGAGPQRQRDRVRRPGADLGAVGEDEVGVEDPVAQGGDVDRAQLDVEHVQDVAEQIVGQRPRRDHALLGEGDRGGFDGTDPDGQVPVTLCLLQQDDRAVGRHLDPDADDLHLPHYSSILTRCWYTIAGRPLPLSRYTRYQLDAERSPPPTSSTRGAVAEAGGTMTPPARPASSSPDSTRAACSHRLSAAICQASCAAAARAPAPRWRSCGPTSCSAREMSRSAAALMPRRLRAPTPNLARAAQARATSSASGP